MIKIGTFVRISCQEDTSRKPTFGPAPIKDKIIDAKIPITYDQKDIEQLQGAQGLPEELNITFNELIDKPEQFVMLCQNGVLMEYNAINEHTGGDLVLVEVVPEFNINAKHSRWSLRAVAEMFDMTIRC